MVYDSAGHRMLALDQVNSGGSARVFAYDGSSWTPLTATGQIPPGPRYGGSWVYDSTRNVGLLFSGSLNCGACTLTNTLFAFSGTNWQQLSWVGTTPPASAGAFGAFDPRRGRAIFLLGTQTAGDYWVTWEWTGTAWERGPTFGPVSIDSFAFDTVRNVGFVAGSGAFNGVVNPEDVWEYTPGATAAAGSWRHVTITGTPYDAGISSTLAFDPFRGRMLRCFGRGSSIISYSPAILTWDPYASTWQHLNYNEYLPESASRGAAGVAYDTARDALVIFGGGRILANTHQFVSYQDTWEQTRGSPGFINHPSNTTVDGGQSAIFAATTIGEGNTLQWLRDGVPVPGATGPILAVNNASQATAGVYVLRVSNACGLIDSLPARLTVLAPTNNSWQTPSVIYAATIAGTTLGATADGAAPCGTSNASPDVWFRYTVPYTGALTMDTCGSNFDTVLSFHSLGSIAATACNDDNPAPPVGCGALQSALSAPVTQGDTFLVRISGYQGAAGNYQLNTRVVPFNNACASATPVFAGTYAGTTTGASTDATASCGTSNTTPDIWYRFRSDCSGTLTLDTSGSSYDTVLSVRSGCGGTELGCNDDVQIGTLWSSLAVTVQPGVDYLIRVSGFNGATGSVVLHVTPPAIAQDLCASAVPVGLGARSFASRCASTGSLPLPPWCEAAAGAVPFYDIWYSYTAALPGVLEVRICNTSFNTALAVYVSCPTSPYQAVQCSAREDSCGNPPMASLSTLPGDQYLLRIGGYYGLNAGLAGSGTIELTLVPFETGACCLAAGGCSLTSALECPGAFQGEGSPCAPSPCPTLAGSCCLGTQCQVVDPSACIAAGGAFGGSGTTCLQSAQNPTTCCRANFNGLGGLSVQDIFDFLNAWFAADPRADFNSLDGVTVQDIFDYLGSWFAGC